MNSEGDVLAFASGVKYVKYLISCPEASAQIWRKCDPEKEVREVAMVLLISVCHSQT